VSGAWDPSVVWWDARVRHWSRRQRGHLLATRVHLAW
jgi:hypothetical protein